MSILPKKNTKRRVIIKKGSNSGNILRWGNIREGRRETKGGENRDKGKRGGEERDRGRRGGEERDKGRTCL